LSTRRRLFTTRIATTLAAMTSASLWVSANRSSAKAGSSIRRSKRRPDHQT
jgi:hypothetical protein